MKRKFWFLALVGAVLLSINPVLADGDFYVIAGGGGVGTKITSLPKVIDTPGFYYVTGNLTCASGNGITINVDNVTIDLMGFCLSGNNFNNGISMNGRKFVEIRNGTLRNWLKAIYESSGSNGVGHRVFNVRAQGNTDGISLYGGGHLIKGCTVIYNGGVGIQADESTINNNIVWGGNTGIIGSGIIRSNTVRGGGAGIQVSYDNNMTSVIGNSVHTFPSQVGIDLNSIGPIIMDQNAVGGTGAHYSGTGGSNVVWAGKSSSYPYGNNAGTP